jgi:choline dehydrogenase-like flavoprotein
MSIRAPFWRVAWTLVPAITLWEACQPIPACADTAAALTALADTADRICGIVSTQGEAGSSKVQGDIHAELNGLARRLATLGGSGSVDISSSKYQGLLQQDLPTALKDLRECKLKVFQQLQAVTLPGTAQQSGAGAPTAELLQAPANAPTVDTAITGDKSAEMALFSCINDTNSTSCYVVLSRGAPTGRVAEPYKPYSRALFRPRMLRLAA